jgi:hypothetical protein
MSRYLTGAIGAAVTGAALLLSVGVTPAHAQRGGSYLESCTNVRAYGDRIIADCRGMGGGWNRTVLRDADSCVGDIGNVNGNLRCNRGRYGDRDQWRRDNSGSSGWDRDQYRRDWR